VSPFRELVLGFFEDDGWRFTETGDGHSWVATVEGEHGRWSTVLQIFDERGVFAFYSLVPVSTPSGRRDDVVEYVTRANAGMVTGNFEIEWASGEVRCKTALDFSDLAPEDVASGSVVRALVKDLAYTNVATCDRYLPGLLRVIAGAARPADAIAEVESPQAP
jgi:hypothetical protein